MNLKQLFRPTISTVINLYILIIFLHCYPTDLYAKEFVRYQKQQLYLKEEIPLTPNEKLWLKKHNPIKVAVKSGWMPVEFQLENQLHRGYTIDYLEKIANLLQINFELIDSNQDFSISQPDIISSVGGRNISDSNFHLLNQPFLVLSNAIYINKQTTETSASNNLESLQSAKVAVYTKGKLANELKENYPKLNLVIVDIADEAFDHLKFGTVDAYVGNEFVIDYHLEVHRLNFIKKVGLTPFTSEVTMAVRNDAPELSSIMEKATTAIGQNNPELFNRWVNKKSNTETILKIALGMILITFGIMSIRYFRLKNKAKQERVNHDLKLWHQANFDYLTDLPNRHQFKSNLIQAIAKAEKHQSKVCLIFIDLDEFKQVNDSSGHSIGDKLLKTCAMRITECVGEEDITARLGGDEFMIVVSGFTSKLSIESICTKLLKAIQSPFEIDGETFFISASIGVTFYPDDSHDIEELVRYADQAMYESKKFGRNQYQFFTSSMQTAIANKTAMINDIRIGIKDHQFELYYQPIINMHDKTTIKAEALIRWNHPQKGIVSPLEFIHLAEESGLMNALGDWVFNRATDDLILIKNEIKSPFHLSINVSPIQFTKPEFLLNWMTLLNQKNIRGEHICLEITESLLLEPSQNVIDIIQSLSEYGVQFAIDDFGTGYSALNYLQNFKINQIKIDKSFTQHLDANHFNETLCNFIIQMAHKLDIKLIAEGVEAIEQENILTALNCDYAQGYLYGKPMPLNQFMTHLKEATPRPDSKKFVPL
jgi:diguanylate cyclase (GGDEF)-like protein